ncbi:hypothetical protein, partial [Micromonospora sp. I033]
ARFVAANLMITGVGFAILVTFCSLGTGSRQDLLGRVCGLAGRAERAGRVSRSRHQVDSAV